MAGRLCVLENGAEYLLDRSRGVYGYQQLLLFSNQPEDKVDFQ